MLEVHTSLIQEVPVKLAGIPFSGKRSIWPKIKNAQNYGQKLKRKASHKHKKQETITTSTHGEGGSQVAGGFAGHQRVERRTEGGE